MRTVERLAPATQRALWKARLWFLAHRLGDTPLRWFDRSKQSRSQYRSDFRQHSNEFVASELDADVGIVLGKGDAPELFRLIARLCQKTGGAFPNEVRLSYLPLCAVMEMPGRVTKSRVLVIGYPALQIWTADELCAVLAHEQGHWNGADAQHLKPYVDQAEWLEAILSRKGGGTIGTLRRSWGKLLSQPIRHHSSQLAWEMEFAADRFAVEHTSPRALASALRKLLLATPVFHQIVANLAEKISLAADTLDEFDPATLDVYREFASAWRNLGTPACRPLRRRLLDAGEQTKSFSHPPLSERLNRLAGFEDTIDQDINLNEHGMSVVDVRLPTMPTNKASWKSSQKPAPSAAAASSQTGKSTLADLIQNRTMVQSVLHSRLFRDRLDPERTFRRTSN